MLKHRLITGPILIVVLMGVIWLDSWVDTIDLSDGWSEALGGLEHPPRGVVLFLMTLLVLAPLAAIELSRVVEANGIRTRAWLMVVAVMAGLVLSYVIPDTTPAIQTFALVSTGLVLVFVAALLTFSQQQTVQGVLAAAGAVVFAMVYLGLMLGFLLALRREHSAWLIVGVIAVTKSCDSGAYFTGRAIGKRKLIPWLSPGKTWEGLVGGVISSIAVGVLLAWVSAALLPEADHVPLWVGAACGAVFAVVGQFGDLTMSLFKRGGGLKDSSTILPGLGGVLDVLDSPLMVAPVAFWMLS